MTGRTLTLTLFGTGSSGGVPRIGNDWGACDPNEPRNYRTRCGAMFELHDAMADDATRVLIDTSADLRVQLLAANVTRIDGVVFTHDHADQTGGIDDLRPLAYLQRGKLPVYMDEQTAASLRQRVRYCFEGHGGYPPILEPALTLIPYEACAIDGPAGALNFLPIEQQHGQIKSLGFRVGPIAYCNDVNELSDKALAELKGVEVFVVDALRLTPHPSHAHLERALAWAEEVGAARTVLTNLHIDMDYQALKATLPERVEPGYDGLALSVPL